MPDEDIIKLLEHARLAQSGKNIQNWHYLVVKNNELKRKLGDAMTARNEEICLALKEKDKVKADMFRNFFKKFTLFFLDAPVLMIVYTTVYYPSGYWELKLIDAPQEQIDDLFKMNPGMQSLGAAMENIALGATEMGYGTCWMTSANYARKEIEAFVAAELHFEKEGFFLGCMMTLGIPDGPQKSPGRKPIEEIYTMYK